jgi:hypothetical protein
MIRRTETISSHMRKAGASLHIEVKNVYVDPAQMLRQHGGHE